MGITRIQVDNLLAVKSVDLNLKKPITIIAGRNGSLKSSIRDAIHSAITREPIRGLKKKDELGQLVHDGQKAGGALVIFDNDADNAFGFNMPKGDYVGPEITEAMRISLDGQRFVTMTPDERRTFLRGLSKQKMSSAMVKDRLLKLGVAETKADAVLPLLRTGWESASKQASTYASDAKRDWCKTTSSKAYGSKIAEAWAAELPDMPAGDAAELEKKIAELDAGAATMHESLGAIKTAANVSINNAARRQALSESSGKVADLAKQLELAKQEVAKFEPQVVALRERAKGGARTGLIHDMADFIDREYKEIGDEASALLERYKAEHGNIGGKKADTEAQSRLPEHEAGLQVLQNRAKNLQRDLDAATQAKDQYDALAPAEDAVDASAEIAEVSALIENAKAQRVALMNQKLDIDACIKNRAEVEIKNKQAKAYHADVVAWTLVADQLAPDGIPAELLKAALEPVNKVLHQAAEDTGWPRVVIQDDMSIVAGGRALQLQSKSFIWRASAMIAQAVSELSGLKVLMLDEFDILDLPARGELLEWLDILVENELIDSAILFGTLKALPEGLADSIAAFWVEDGGVVGTENKAAA